MSDFAIRVEYLTKQYRIGQSRTEVTGWRKVQTKLVSPFGYLASSLRQPDHDESIWALRDVSFEIQPGEAVGIIGRNGAGKSTLLKILSRITDPTSGRAFVRGRMGSLLEVGTGFHPELTGRENVYLSGAIFGLRKAEIERKFDDIVQFSGVEKFIDTQFKRYSSGMRVRLGFAVAAHLEPEILIVDEVLAVGDAEFQKKCLNKMGDVAKGGRTVLLVSHNMVALQSLCQRAIWLEDGKVNADGETIQVVSRYLRLSASDHREIKWETMETAPGNDKVRLHQLCVHPVPGTVSDTISTDTPIAVEIEFWNPIPGAKLHVTLHFYTEQQIVAFSSASGSDPEWRGRPLPVGLYRSVCHIPGNLLNSGVHRITLLVVEGGSKAIYWHDDILTFEVQDLRKRQGAWFGKEPGAVHPDLEWHTEALNGATSL